MGKDTKFGGADANPQNAGGFKGGGKTNRQWVSEITQMNEQELQEFVLNLEKPQLIRKMATAMLNMSTTKDVATVLDMTESKPVQLVDTRTTNQMSQEEFLENIEKASGK